MYLYSQQMNPFDQNSLLTQYVPVTWFPDVSHCSAVEESSRIAVFYIELRLLLLLLCLIDGAASLGLLLICLLECRPSSWLRSILPVSMYL